MANIIDGKSLADKIKTNVKQEIQTTRLQPGLAIILVGDDPASHLYVKLKKQACEQVGIDFHLYQFSGDVDQAEVLETIGFLNADPDIDALLVQLPLPAGLDERLVTKSIDPAKDVDGFHPENIAKLLLAQPLFSANGWKTGAGLGEPTIVPGLVLGIWELIRSTGENVAGQQAVLLGNSDTFLSPLSFFLQQQGLKCRTIVNPPLDPSEYTRGADVLVVAVGRPFYIKGPMVKPGAIIIDVGTNRLEKGHIVGDVDYTDVFPIAAWITPVPGGVGPMTVAMLLENALELAKRRRADSAAASA